MSIASRIFNSFIFWSAWIIIPVLMEILPAMVGIFLLLRRRRREKGYPKPAIYPEISVIIPVYNSQDTLFQCIESIARSTYPNESIRLFLVNNKGQDDSFSVYARAQESFPDLRMQWLNAEQGKSRALNLALYNSEGKYIVNLDSDGLLEKHALTNLVNKFEALPELNCMTGAILTMPDAIRQYKNPLGRLLRELEFMEYAQAFLAGRSYASETNSVYTLSGAFSAFRKSAVLSSWMYNTDTICEDTHMTFQIRYKQGERVEICEDAIFFVDPIEDLNKLYTQRQRWQRGSLEVAQMFMDRNFKIKNLFTNVNVRTLLYDHTFAFPRMIWYLALLCLLFLGFAADVILYSTAFIFLLYILVGFVYFGTVAALLRFEPELRRYYVSHWWCVALLPFFNLMVFFVRMAGIVNSISTPSSWRTRNLTEEWSDFCAAARGMAEKPLKALDRIRAAVNRRPVRGGSEKAFCPCGALWYLTTGLLYAVGALLILAVWWSRKTFGVGFSEIVTTLLGPVEGTDGGMIDEIVHGLVLPFAGILACIALLSVLGGVLGRRARKRGVGGRAYRFLHTAALALGAVLLLSGALYANAEYDMLSYFASLGSRTTLYEQYYVNPRETAVTAPERPKNLIYIYVESFETTYASREVGGKQSVNYIPRLTELARQNINFSDNGALGGFHSLHGTNWTMAALLATTSGIPFELPADTTIEDSGYFAGVATLGDILAENGYNQEFVCGSDGHFAGRKEYFELHGRYDVCDLYAAHKKGWAGNDKHTWGMEDKVLFDLAREEVTALADEGKPFNFTLLTVDLHAPNGYVCQWCGSEHPESVTGTVAACSDRLTADFIDWCSTQPFWDDTVVIVTGDHPRMDMNLVDGIDYYDRTVYNCFIGSAAQPQLDTKSRTFTTMDMFPSILAALGFEIEGDRLGLGTNLFSGRETLAERFGAEWLDAEMAKSSDYYMENFTN